MKGNIKKLVVFVMIAAIAMFTAAALASANDHEWNAIHGEYTMVGVGTCLISPSAFDNYAVPSSAAVSSYASHDTFTGIWTFKRGGKGTAQVTQFKLFPSPRPSSNPRPQAASLNIDFEFNYTVNDDGTITGAIVPETYNSTCVTGLSAGPPPVTLKVDQLLFDGTFSEDHKTILLSSENEPMQVDAYRSGNYLSTSYVICNTVRTLIRLGEIEHKGKGH
jgi:hypothetical protein